MSTRTCIHIYIYIYGSLQISSEMRCSIFCTTRCNFQFLQYPHIKNEKLSQFYLLVLEWFGCALCMYEVKFFEMVEEKVFVKSNLSSKAVIGWRKVLHTIMVTNTMGRYPTHLGIVRNITNSTIFIYLSTFVLHAK